MNLKDQFQPINLKKETGHLKKDLIKEVFLISSGPKLNEYKKEIEKYIIKNKPFVIALNTSVKINKRLINLYVACNPLKLMTEVEQYKILSHL